MEQKNLKSSVFANEIIFKESAEQPIDVEFTLPDYCPEISKILKCKAVSRITSKGLNGRNITVDGIVTVTIIYCDSDSVIGSYEYQYPFNKSFEISEDIDSANIFAKSKCEYINCRAITGRKIDLHGAIVITVKLLKKKATEIISDIDESCVELRRSITPSTMPMGYAEKYLIIEEEIEVGHGQPSIRSILRYDTSVVVKDSKIVNNKVVVKGDLTVCALYCPDGSGTPQVIKATVPFSQLLDIEGITDMCECDSRVEVCFVELKPRSTADGECKIIAMNVKLLISTQTFCNNDIPVLLDAYCRKHQSNIVKSDVCFEKISDNISEIFNCKKNLEFVDGAMGSIADLWCEVQTGSTKCEGKQILIKGMVTVCIIAYDVDNAVSYYERPIEFEYKYIISKSIENLRCEPQIEVVSSSYTITSSSKMELRIDLSINAAVYELNTVPLIIDFEIDEKSVIDKKNNGAMIIYFANNGETVWDIARKYSSAVDEIMQINGLEDDNISSDKTLLIPVN